MSRSYTRCPCETCIVLAVCKGKSEYILCSFLYKYMRSGIEYHGIPNTKQKYRKKKIESIFGKKFHCYGFVNTYKENPEFILWWET